jgi:glycerol-3-phosphate acyltransferase PlsX
LADTTETAMRADAAAMPADSDAFTIAMDAMGGDRAPAVIVEGALEYVRDQGRGRLLLVGDETLIRGELERLEVPPGTFGIIHAPETVGMAEAAASSVRRKPRSSISVGVRLVKEGKADAVVSAGNTGAAVAVCQLRLRPLPEVDRPAIATCIPTEGGGCVLLDVGANSDCKPVHLLQFAIMGAVYAHHILDKPNPRVGLLNIGEESSKGNELAQASHQLLKRSSLNFVGNVEGRDIFRGAADVVVCDGFTGNIVLKFSESVVELLTMLLRREITRDQRSKLGAWMLRPAFRRFRKELDYAEYGGAPLLGINGACVIAHGSSSPKAIKNAIRVAGEFVDHHLNELIAAAIAAVPIDEIDDSAGQEPLNREAHG